MLIFYLSLLERQDDRARFEALYLRCKGLMCSRAFALTQDRQMAEDAVHNAFMYIIDRFHQMRFDNERELTSLVMLITHSKAVDLLRKQARESPSPDEALNETPEDSLLPLEELAVTAAHISNLADALSHMDIKYRAPLSLKAKGYKTNEIAELLGLGFSTVKTRLYRGRRLAREMLTELMADEQ